MKKESSLNIEELNEQIKSKKMRFDNTSEIRPSAKKCRLPFLSPNAIK
ncbi:MAG: hypothetical protein M3033_13455 [Acidobacteriota bacterium]|nr:hypothetical protein [Acidobacteriota bacterium]